LRELFHIIGQDDHFQAVVAGLERNVKEQLLVGLPGTARMLYVATLYQVLKRPMLVVTHNLNQAQKASEDLQELLDKQEVLLYPANELVTTEIASAGHETLGEQVEVLSKLSQGFSGVLVIPFAGLRRLFLPKHLFAQSHMLLEVGSILSIHRLLEQLIGIGYQRVEMVERPGECSVRGGIVDIYPVTFTQPVRMEWFDDEIESIRPFSVTDQRSTDKWEQVMIPPAQVLFAAREALSQAGEMVTKLLEEHVAGIQESTLKQKYRQSIGWDIEQLRAGNLFTGIYKYIQQIYPDCENLFGYMPENTLLVLDEPTRIIESTKQMEREEGEWQIALLQQGEFLPQLKISLPYHEAIMKKDRLRIYLSLFMRQIPGSQLRHIRQVVCRGMQQFHGQMHVLKAEWDRWGKANYRVIFLAGTKERLQRLVRVLADYGMEVTENVTGHPLLPRRPVIQVGSLQNGFELSQNRVAVVTEGEVFTQKRRQTRHHVKLNHAEKIKDYQELKPGDYVVHINHGIGRYVGVETLHVGGMHKDYLHIQYAGNDKLYVPMEQIDQVQKYVGSEEKIPKVYSLGSHEWSKVKNKVRSSVQNIAQDLIKLYAKRQAAKGFSFSQDTPYQGEFEAIFPYEETPDQLRSTQEIKRDMEKVQPMDRLLCGDVGYGKTEVAIRAAFKAVMDGKQVAMLVPTTILAQQHFETFRERFAGYPIQIRVLSRFSSRKEQKETIAALKNGTLDIVIGTHRLLSKDIVYRELGLLIIDEEQRFGVKHKEKMKQMKHNIDVLALSATPIPRTLHMAMMGVRDLSVIETPPENRFPVQTYVLEYSAALVREAIVREMARGGQVYFLYNQVQNIDWMANQIRMLIPEAKVAVAHGQMADAELEKVMLDFLDEEFDVLVSTTIIETGVDIPNVNTLIIYHADKMGLSQLYQLRGRVGRSNRIAYAYFTYQRDKVLSEAAEKRLQAIKEFTELGSGFKIAMRDLSIRGAGNLLGAEQHGHIATVGFELYSQMLKEAVAALQGKREPVSIAEPQIELQVDAYLPSEYIRDEKQKVEIYKKIRSTPTLQAVIALEEEMEDRFGLLPESVQSLLHLARIRTYAVLYGVEIIEQKGKEITLKFYPAQNERIVGEKLFKIVQEFPGKIYLSVGRQISITFRVQEMSSKAALAMMEQFLIKYERVLKQGEDVQSAEME
jgi:transcription-repair coupling factor (superfamily II helicase)